MINLAQKYIQIDELGRTREMSVTIDAQIQQKIKDHLNPQDFQLFKAAEQLNSQLWQMYVDQGLLSSEVVYQNIYIPELDQNMDIEVGIRNTLGPNVHPSQIAMHPAYAEWLAQLPAEVFQID
jgi:hypothetical protein